MGREIDLPWEHQEVVIGKAAVEACVHELVNRQAIWGGIFVKLIERLGWVKERESHISEAVSELGGQLCQEVV